jgi:hypothetical protein
MGSSIVCWSGARLLDHYIETLRNFSGGAMANMASDIGLRVWYVVGEYAGAAG